MELYSGLPYWIAKNELNQYHNPLREEVEADIAIIGTGITGALAANELCRSGFNCIMIEKRGVAEGSSTSSTALLQYEIDLPLHKMAEKVGERNAVIAYRTCFQAIDDIRDVFKKIHFDPGFKHVPSLQYASNRRDADMLRREYGMRKRHGLPVEFLEKKELRSLYGIDAPAALYTEAAAQMDTYAGATALVYHNMRRKGLRVFTHTEVIECTPINDGYIVATSTGHAVKCRYLIIAAGFEAGRFLPERVMKLTSTYAFASQPVDENKLWRDRALIWETATPYIYIRTEGNRIIAGGEDDEFKNPRLRDSVMPKRIKTLEKKFNRLFPAMDIKTDMVWCGTFSSTEDGLPFIGPYGKGDRMLYSLGYGGNGITFSMAGAQILRNIIEGKPDERIEVFGFDRSQSSAQEN